MKKRIVVMSCASFLVVAAVAVALFIGYKNSAERRVPLVFSNNALLLELWDGYKKTNIETGSHRTLDRQQNNITTSEGQGYTMLRAVWLDDKTTFDQSWQWSQMYQQRPDHLFSWKYGPRADGSYGIQTDVSGQNTASDGDSDIALSLLMAYSRWNDSKYLDAARPIISSMWDKEVVSVAGKPVLVADDLERNSKTTVVVNPSYFAPYAYKVFAKADKNKQHDWTALADNSYNLIAAASKSPLDKSSSDGLPPDWLQMDRVSGVMQAPAAGMTTNYSYDAMRTPWRLALDWQWFHDPRDKQVLDSFSYLQKSWRGHGKLAASYTHDGQVSADYEAPAIYGGSIGYFVVSDPADGTAIYKQKLQTLYSADKQAGIDNLGYYDANWIWFGIALWQGALPNLTASK